MDKRTILAVTLSLAVLLSWSLYTAKFKPSTQVAVKNEVTTNNLSVTSVPLAIEPQQALVTTPLTLASAEVNFIAADAAIKSLTFKNFQNYKLELHSGFLLGDGSLKFSATSLTNPAVFTYQDQEKKITKSFTFSQPEQIGHFKITIQNLTNSKLDIALPIILAKIVQYGGVESGFQEFVIFEKNTTVHRAVRKSMVTTGPVKFIALREHYFSLILEPISGQFTGFVNKIDNKNSYAGLNLVAQIPSRAEVVEEFNFYIGPQKQRVLAGLNKDWASIIYYGSLDPIAKLLLYVLEFFHKISFNWGLAIILLSLFVYLLLYPLTLKQMRSMKEMQMLQPKIEDLRKVYKDNPQKLNKEIMLLYKEHKINPLGGCLPLLLQMPIFFALYQALMRSVELKGAGFLWIKDLSSPDKLITLPVSLPVLGNELNILPILMAIGMFVQQKMTAKVSVGSSAEQQRIMMIVMPIMFGFIFYHMPSGLVLYWFVNSLLMLGSQIKTSRAT